MFIFRFCQFFVLSFIILFFPHLLIFVVVRIIIALSIINNIFPSSFLYLNHLIFFIDQSSKANFLYLPLYSLPLPLSILISFPCPFNYWTPPKWQVSLWFPFRTTDKGVPPALKKDTPMCFFAVPFRPTAVGDVGG